MTLLKTGDKTLQTSREKIDDTSITAQVKMALLLHQSTSALQITVKTKRGVVTLGANPRIRQKKTRSPNS
jgi:osmotically-inducible protein OsmY